MQGRTDALRRVLKFIDEQLQRDISLNEVAEAAFLSPNYLSQLLKKQTGTFLVHIPYRGTALAMPDLMSGNRNCREGFPIEYRGRQADRFADRIVVVARLGRFHFDVLQVKPIEQMPGQFCPGSGIVRTGGAMLGKHPLGPELWPENHQTDDDHEQNETYHISQYPNSPSPTKIGG